MILPETVIAACIDLIKNDKDNYPYGMEPVPGSEDTELNADKLSVVIYADFDSDAQLAANGFPAEIPVSIYFTCLSGSHETAAESFNEAFLMAVTCIKTITRSNRMTLENAEGTNELILLVPQNKPLMILRKSAECSVVQAAFKYNLMRI